MATRLTIHVNGLRHGKRLDQPATGSGEPTTAAVPAAIANAVFDATVVRYPMTTGYVRAPLSGRTDPIPLQPIT